MKDMFMLKPNAVQSRISCLLRLACIVLCVCVCVHVHVAGSVADVARP